MRALVPVVLVGMLALLYHLYAYTHYSLRGGNSGLDSYCGIFFVHGNFGDSTARWSVGTALDYYFIL